MTTLSTGCIRHAFPGSILLLAGPLPPCNTVTGSIPCQVAEGKPCLVPAASLQYTVSLSSESTVCFLPGGVAAVASQGFTHTYNGNISHVSDISLQIKIQFKNNTYKKRIAAVYDNRMQNGLYVLRRFGQCA